MASELAFCDMRAGVRVRLRVRVGHAAGNASFMAGTCVLWVRFDMLRPHVAKRIEKLAARSDVVDWDSYFNRTDIKGNKVSKYAPR